MLSDLRTRRLALCIPPFETRQHPVGGERYLRDSGAVGVGRGVGGGGTQGMGCGPAKPGAASFVVRGGSVEMHENLADIAVSGIFVKLYVGFQFFAGLLIHAPLFIERRADANDAPA